MPQTGNDITAYYNAWAQMMVTIWQDKMIAKNIRDTGALLESFKTEVVMSASGDVQKIVHTYLYYGRMVDMGVGRGVPKSEAGSVSGRRPKPWYNKPYYHSIKVLTEKTAALYGQQFQAILMETLTF